MEPNIPMRPGWAQRLTTGCAVASAAALLAACSGGDGDSTPPSPPPSQPEAALACDDTMKSAFKPDADTQVLLVKPFKQGDPLALAGTTGTPPTAAADLCMVKLLVGPGSPGTAGAASTSAGIGIEVWLPSPAKWNERIRNLGGGGWAGGTQASTTLVGNANAASVAASGYVVGTTDTGHTAPAGSFAMREDGGINATLWKDFAERSLQQLALKTKALARAYYLKPQKYAYWEGCSTGGRQGYKMAQEHPDAYDGYVIEAPAMNWTRFISYELYPQVVMQRDLGGNLSGAQLGLVSAAAVSACGVVGGQALGFITDPRQCRYDPTRDAAVLCNGAQGNGVVGTSSHAACVNLAQAQAINKVWYGQTADGSVPDPLVDNASNATLANSNQLWWGLSRGAFLGLLAGDAASPPFFGPFPIATDMAALTLQDPGYATPTFTNPSGNGQNRWRSMTYADLAGVSAQGDALQPFFGGINTDKPDLSRARAKGAKIIHFHGWGDQLIPAQGSINYYTRMANAAGGFAEAQKFNRLFMVPALGHCGGVGSVSGLSGPAATPNNVPLPGATQFFDLLVDWVENNNAPERVVLRSADASVSMPVCPFPKKPVYAGSGSPTAEGSYSCQ
ncbi:tannase/feruloyl esterase family alpha/beta hydrolase [Pseudaquabacterium pictum]|uniref:Tannase n=1 Tax=Pseudaquabacterium pictum TaxID=2315236 RepID=A0A480AWC1_9BURK|nr:tannase/feruloyl esterase family alpha/beta hydrolase [Rubrivivax pictus]GCL63088.1 tannase [Rubrivivax pictus]